MVGALFRIKRLDIAPAVFVAPDPAVDRIFTDPAAAAMWDDPFSATLVVQQAPFFICREPGPADKLVDDPEAEDRDLFVFLFRHQNPSFCV